MSFISLHNHTHFSVLDAIPTPEELMMKAKELGQEAVAITDHGSLAGVWSAYKAWKTTGVKPIIGCECYFVDDKEQLKEKEKFRHIILIAKNAVGYRNLLTLNRRGFENIKIDLKKSYSIIDWKLLEQYKEGLICLTSCGNGILSSFLMKKDLDGFNTALNKLKSMFGDDLGLEIQANNLTRNATAFHSEVDQNFINRQMIIQGKKHNVKVVPTCNSHYLNKDDNKIHDVMIAIASHQPVYSNFRLKYPVPDFYLKSEAEIKDFFSRNYGEEQAQLLIDNTKYFADKCENPEWIDPKFSNPSGKELPIFPIKKEKDYEEFLTWSKNQSDKIQTLKEDEQFLRYRTEIGLKTMIPAEKFAEYQARCEEEFDVLEHHGFSSYMLIVADYVNWAKNNGVAAGPGRGCLTADTMVLTDNGFKNLDKISTSDKVYSHTGKLQSVLNTFKFDVTNEDLLKIKTNHSFNDIVLTKDHKVYACKAIETEKYKRVSATTKKTVKRYEKYENLSWIEAEKLSKNDVIYTTFPIRNNINAPIIKIGENEILINKDICYLIGRFVGDGWFRIYNPKINKGYHVGIAFNSNDRVGIDKIKNILKSIGFDSSEIKHKKQQLIQLMVYKKDLAIMFSNLLPNYKSTSNTKHLPSWFRTLPDDMLNSLLSGVIDSDGHIDDRINIDSTSLQLILEIKEALLFLKKSSSITTRQPYKRDKYQCNISYKLRVGKDKNQDDKGYYSKILDIKNDKSDYVYDITVENDHSYLTTNYIVHNSVGGCMVAYLIGIHQADPIKYDLIFARFHNKEKKAFPDCDCDFSTGGRNKVLNYLSEKYGKDNVAHVSNINTMTPKVYAKDIARACEFGGSADAELGMAIADSIPVEAKDIDDALRLSPIFTEYCKRYPQLLENKAIDGRLRAFSTHAGGIIISQRPLVGLVPVRLDKEGNVALEYDKDQAEENGLVKMDILGLSTLDIIDKTHEIMKNVGISIPQENDYKDQITYDLISKGDTFCVFQLGTSGGTAELCRQIHPSSIDDISHINSLARPSAKDMRSPFVQTKAGKKKVSLVHPSLQRSFGNTYGFGLYEESLFYLAQDVAGWTLNEADRLRKMTKDKGKNPEKVKALRKEFIDGGVKKEISEYICQEIWDNVIDKFQGYGFNKSLHFSQNIDIYSSEGQYMLTKPISEIKPGDYVKSRSEKNKQETFIKVINKHDHGILPLVEVQLDTGETVKCTMDHKFRVKETGKMEPLWKIIEKDLSIVVGK